MRISVVMPVYNAEKFLRSSIASVVEAAKRFDGETELICVDDGSTDASGAFLDAAARIFDLQSSAIAIRVIHKANGGVSSARNAGMAAATGELIAFLDADDAYHPEALSAVAALFAAKSAEVIRLGWRTVTDGGAPSVEHPQEACWREIDFPRRQRSSIFISCLGSATVVARRIAEQVRWPDLRQGEDLVFTLSCFAKSTRRYQIDCALVDYRVHPDSASHRITPELVFGTCGYLPRVVELCSALGEGAVAHLDTYRHVMDLLCRRIFGSWRLFDDAAERRRLLAAFWSLTERLAQQKDFFPPPLRFWATAIAARRNPLLFRMGLAWPYRLMRHFSGGR